MPASRSSRSSSDSSPATTAPPQIQMKIQQEIQKQIQIHDLLHLLPYLLNLYKYIYKYKCKCKCFLFDKPCLCERQVEHKTFSTSDKKTKVKFRRHFGQLSLFLSYYQSKGSDVGRENPTLESVQHVPLQGAGL